jgi:hypothetical protein
MGSSVISTAMHKVDLVAIRFSKIHAEVGVNSNLKGGNLHVGNTLKLSAADKQKKAIGSVGISVMGFPKGVTDNKSYAFRLELTVEGDYQWEGEEPIWTDPIVENSILQSLYVVATLEVASLAQKLGFPNVELPIDLKISKSLVEKTTKKKVMAPKKKKTVSSKSPTVKA